MGDPYVIMMLSEIAVSSATTSIAALEPTTNRAEMVGLLEWFRGNLAVQHWVGGPTSLAGMTKLAVHKTTPLLVIEPTHLRAP